jgi:hypothetical protein
MAVSDQHDAQPRFNPGERTSGRHWIGGWVGLRAGLDTGYKKNPFSSVVDRTSVVQSIVKILYWLSYPSCSSLLLLLCGETMPLWNWASVPQTIHKWIWITGTMILAGELKESEKNLSQYHFVNHKSHTDCPGCKSRPCSNKLATNHLCYSTAIPCTQFLYQ